MNTYKVSTAYPLKILFVTRKFPPAVGGMENIAAELYTRLSKKATVQLVAVKGKKGGKNILLPFAYLWLLIRAIRDGYRQRPDIIYAQDGVMAPMALVLRKLLKCPVVITIHGTEVAYSNPVYRKLVLPYIGRMDRAVVISDGTAEKTRQVLPQLPVTKVVWGADDSFYIDADKLALKAKLEEELGLSLGKGPCIYLAGRLTERKGAVWFVERVMPSLVERMPSSKCLIAGEGKDGQKLAGAIQKLNLADNVIALGTVLGETRRLLYNAADLFIMPNIPGYGFEGFGMVAIEASSCGTPVIASGLEGITDAVIDGRTGWLVPPENATAYIEKISEELARPTLQRAEVRKTTLETFDWDRTGNAYLRIFQEVVDASKAYHLNSRRQILR